MGASRKYNKISVFIPLVLTGFFNTFHQPQEVRIQKRYIFPQVGLVSRIRAGKYRSPNHLYLTGEFIVLAQLLFEINAFPTYIF